VRSRIVFFLLGGKYLSLIFFLDSFFCLEILASSTVRVDSSIFSIIRSHISEPLKAPLRDFSNAFNKIGSISPLPTAYFVLFWSPNLTCLGGKFKLIKVS
jgi:hypothetical protein